MPGFKGTVTLYMDDQAVGKGDIVTQPGPFNEVGDGICVGRDSASAVTPDYTAPFNSRVERSTRSSSTCRVRSTSTTKRRSEAGSSRTSGSAGAGGQTG